MTSPAQNAGNKHPAMNNTHGSELKLTLDPPNKVFFITADARMPKIKVTCQLPNPAPAGSPAVSGQTASPVTAAQSYDWDVTVILNLVGVPYAVGRITRHSPIRVTTAVPELILPFTQIRGGTLSVTVATTLQGKRMTGKTVAEIRGTNPSATLIRAEGAPEILMKLMKLESSLRQFLSTRAKAGYPVFSHDGFGGVGLGQITHPRPTDDEVWDWKANIKAAKAQWDSKRNNDAEEHLKNYSTGKEFRALVQAYNAKRAASSAGGHEKSPPKAGTSPSTPLKALTITLPSITDEMIENETLRLYNGEPSSKGSPPLREYKAEVDENGFLLVDVAQDGANGKARWQRVSAADRTATYDSWKLAPNRRGDPDYVNHVRSQVVN